MMRKELGQPWGQALSWRAECLRQGLAAHWALNSRMRAHQGSFRDDIEAADLVGILSDEEKVELREQLALANWARHSALPGVATLQPTP